MLKHGSSKRRGIAKVIALAAVFSAIGATGTVDAASRPTVTVTVDDGDGGRHCRDGHGGDSVHVSSSLSVDSGTDGRVAATDDVTKNLPAASPAPALSSSVQVCSACRQRRQGEPVRPAT